MEWRSRKKHGGRWVEQKREEKGKRGVEHNQADPVGRLGC